MQKRTLITCQIILLSLISGRVLSQLKANFAADITSGCAPIVVKFTDKSTGNPISWRWDLGNGTSTGLQNPSATYVTPGVYAVKLKIKNAAQQYDSIVKTAFITVLKPPTVNFSGSVTTGCNPVTINFTDQSTGDFPAKSMQWDFGDGSISSDNNPSHTYAVSGKYSVTLKVTNTMGCFAAQRKADYIKVNGIVPDFTTVGNYKCLPNKITFNNTTTSKDSFSCSWDFGDSSVSSELKPTHQYAKGGTYAVSLTVKSVKGCESTITKQLVVQNPVSAVFTADKTYSCSYPAAIQFSNEELPGNSYTWTFGDASGSNLSRPLHLYGDSGTYAVKLVVKNTNGCADSLTRKNYITLQQSSFGFLNLPDSGCKGFTTQMQLIPNAADSLLSYSWNFGDGTFSTLAAPEKSYDAVGYYNVSVAVTSRNGCADTVSLNNAIKIGNKPVAKFTADSLIRCAGQAVQFINQSENATSWLWDFGGNITSDQKDPFQKYKDTGWVNVMLIAKDGGCADTAEAKDFIYLKPAVADFLPAMNCATPFIRKFTNGSVSANQYAWNFGDGNTSTAVAPTHQYAQTGYYTVSLTATNDSTGCSYYTSKQIKIIKVIPSFFASDTVKCRGSLVDFTAYVDSSDIGKYVWSFGDGSTLTTVKKRVSHIYSKPGLYTVRLITLNMLNCYDTLVKTGYIKIVGPVAKYGVSSLTPCINNAVNFLDSSIAEPGIPITNWTWNYGDGKTETFGTNAASHVYTARGSFATALNIIDQMGCVDSIKLAAKINVIRLDPTILISTPVACPGTPVKFTAPYAEKDVKYTWDLGDSATAKTQIVNHAYANEGSYNISLHLEQNGCVADKTISNGVVVKETTASFLMSDSFKTCPPLLINFTDSSVNAASLHWDFGDSSSSDLKNPSHLYTYPGRYTATLYSKGPGACVRTMQKTIIVNGPTGTLSFTPSKQCRPYNASFKVNAKDAVSYVWDFNDGNTSDTYDSVVTHVYQDSGFFVPKIILVDNLGCRVPVTAKDTLKNLFVKTAFTFPDSVLCDKGTVSFVNTSFSNDALATFLWNFGDNSTSASRNPSHTYGAAGQYYPSLSVTTAYGCTSQYKSAVAVKLGTMPLADMAPVANGCMPLKTTFKGIETGVNKTNLKWQWDFANGNTSNLKEPPGQTYNTDGIYNVRLDVISDDGCVKSFTKALNVYALPVLNTTPDTVICNDSRVTLNVSGAATYKWTPTNAVACDTCASTLIYPAVASRFFVRGTSVHGCVSKDSVQVAVRSKPVITYGGTKNVCKGNSTQLYANGAVSYKWSPATGLDNAAISNPKAIPDTTTKYAIVGYDDIGCHSDTGYVNVVVNSLPQVDAGPDKKINVGGSTELVATISPDVSEVKWSPTDAIFRYSTTSSITVKPQQNTEYTVEVKNNNGCAAKDRVTVFVLCDGTNVFIPNLFSPNGDGNNDIFYVRGNGLYKIKSLVIFDRWGQVVFKNNSFNSNDPKAGWDGTLRGTKLNTDVFVYTIEVVCSNNSVLTFSGNIALVR